MDFSKAYDTIWRNALYYKMVNIGVSKNFVQLMQSMYSSLSAQVMLPDGMSKSFLSQVGVKQGCNLSPTLFNIFINDLVTLCNQTENDSPDLDGITVSCLLYADDLVLISKSKNGLQNLLTTLDTFCSKWFMQVNLKKTKCLIFGKRRTWNELLMIGNKTIDCCENYVFLGTLMNWNGSFKSAIDAQSKKATGASYSLTNNIAKFKSCSFSVLMKLFDCLVSPISYYNSKIWVRTLLNPVILAFLIFKNYLHQLNRRI